MSKRSGEFVTLRDVVDEVGRDPIRFMMVFRKNDAPLDFDFEKVTEQSKDNPVFYVQYAHARTCSVFRQAEAEMPGLDTDVGALLRARRSTGSRRCRRNGADPPFGRVSADGRGGRRGAMSRTASPSISTTSPPSFTPTGIAARSCRNCGLSIASEPELTAARLALVRGVQLVLSTGLNILGVSAPDEMR